MAIRVFIVDDHTVVREGLKVLLETDPDIEVVGGAADGRAAIRAIKKLCPDIVLMDIAMPKLNGVEATRLIMEMCLPTKVIILSMLSSKEHVSRALQAGASGYLKKESAGKDVIRAVHAVYLGRHYLNSGITDLLIEDYVASRKGRTALSPLDKLSFREKEVLQLVVEGNSSAQVAEILALSRKTVETYRSRIMQKLDIKGLPGLVKFAIRHGLISLDV